MITQKIYDEQIERIEGAIGRQLIPGSYSIWKEELNKNNINDVDLIAGVDRGIIEWEGGKLPSVGQLIEKCRFERKERIFTEENQRKAREQRDARQRGGNPITNILEKGKDEKGKARAWIDLTYQLLNGEIDKETFNLKHKEIGEGRLC